MIKNRKPMFVSSFAHALLQKLALREDCTMGDIVERWARECAEREGISITESET